MLHFCSSLLFLSKCHLLCVTRLNISQNWCVPVAAVLMDVLTHRCFLFFLLLPRFSVGITLVFQGRKKWNPVENAIKLFDLLPCLSWKHELSWCHLDTGQVSSGYIHTNFRYIPLRSCKRTRSWASLSKKRSDKMNFHFYTLKFCKSDQIIRPKKSIQS